VGWRAERRWEEGDEALRQITTQITYGNAR